MKIGPTIRDVRRSKRMTLEQVRLVSGLSVTYLSAIERGSKSNFNISTLLSIAGALDIPIQALFMLAMEEGDIVGMEKFLPGVRNSLKELTYNIRFSNSK